MLCTGKLPNTKSNNKVGTLKRFEINEMLEINFDVAFLFFTLCAAVSARPPALPKISQYKKASMCIPQPKPLGARIVFVITKSLQWLIQAENGPKRLCLRVIFWNLQNFTSKLITHILKGQDQVNVIDISSDIFLIPCQVVRSNRDYKHNFSGRSNYTEGIRQESSQSVCQL